MSDLVIDAAAIFPVTPPHKPVYWSEELQGWIATAYADVVAGLKDDRLWVATPAVTIERQSSAVREKLEPVRRSVLSWVGRGEDENHRRLQRLIRAWFSPDRLERLRSMVDEIVAGLLAPMRDGQDTDLIQSLAVPIPILVAAELLGLPADATPKLKLWADKIARLWGPFHEADFIEGQQSVLALYDEMRPIAESRRRQPEDDFIGMLVQAHERGEVRGDDELLGNCVMLLFASYETTANLLGNGMLLLLLLPELQQRLRSNLALMPGAVEEMLRFTGPAQAVGRYAIDDVELGGQSIRKGQSVYLVFGWANRDAGQFADPDAFVAGRVPNEHIGFGLGRFYCLGAALARIELNTCFSQLLARTRQIEPLFERPDGWDEESMLAPRQLRTLRVRLHRR